MSSQDIQRIGDPFDGPEDHEEGWFDVQEDQPLLPDWLPSAPVPSPSPTPVPFPVVTANPSRTPGRSGIANRYSPSVPKSWTIASVPEYQPTPKMITTHLPSQMSGPLAATVPKDAPTPGTPLLDETHPVLQLDDFSDLFLEQEEPVADVATSSQDLHTPVKRARQKSPDRKQSVPLANPPQLQPDTETREVLRNLQKTTSDIAASMERVARETTRQSRLLDRQNDFLQRICTALLQVRDDIHRPDRKENRAPLESVIKNVKK